MDCPQTETLNREFPLFPQNTEEKKSMEEIAQKMNFSGADSAKSQKSKCMRKLTPLIQQYQRL